LYGVQFLNKFKIKRNSETLGDSLSKFY
jgi:hypothetical protein